MKKGDKEYKRSKKESYEWRDKIEKILVKNNDTAMQCYLECLAVECGEGECSKSIRLKYNLNTNHD